ncbi:MAG TPA: hypothetical protein VKB34_18085, partial [Povalibacter sp.]|nr:hypothetical protein [Povalibacter sp.]
MNYKPLIVFLSLCFGLPAPGLAMNTENVGPMKIVLPDDWKREVRPDGTVAFVVGEPGSRSGEVQFFTFVVPNAEPAAVHQAIWNNMLGQMDAPGEQQSGRSGRFDWSQMQATD